MVTYSKVCVAPDSGRVERDVFTKNRLTGKQAFITDEESALEAGKEGEYRELRLIRCLRQRI